MGGDMVGYSDGDDERSVKVMILVSEKQRPLCL